MWYKINYVCAICGSHNVVHGCKSSWIRHSVEFCHRHVGLRGFWKFIFPDEDGGSKLLQYVGNYLIINIVSYPRRLEHTYCKSSTVYIQSHAQFSPHKTRMALKNNHWNHGLFVAGKLRDNGFLMTRYTNPKKDHPLNNNEK